MDFPDISVWQGIINWDAVHAAGYTVASIKATEGNGFTDPQFARNASETGRLGFQRIFYGFARPDLGNSPEAEADWLWAVVSPYFRAGDALEDDMESGWPSQDWLNRYQARLATHGPGGTYSGTWFMGPRGLSYVGFSHVASYGGPAPSADLWQYTDAGSVPGISGGVDLNRVLNAAVFQGGNDMGVLEGAQADMLQRVYDTTNQLWGDLEGHADPAQASSTGLVAYLEKRFAAIEGEVKALQTAPAVTIDYVALAKALIEQAKAAA